MTFAGARQLIERCDKIERGRLDCHAVRVEKMKQLDEQVAAIDKFLALAGRNYLPGAA